jgi:MoxR-like ATPase
MRDEMDPPVYCSDRRLVKAAGMLRIVAATHGKATVSLQDCLLLQHVLWYHPDDQKALRDWLLKRVVPETGDCFHHSFYQYCALLCTAYCVLRTRVLRSQQ